MVSFSEIDIGDTDAVLNLDGKEISLKKNELRFYIKMFNLATETDFLAGIIKEGIESGDFNNDVERLLLHWCPSEEASWDEVTYKKVCDEVIEHCNEENSTDFELSDLESMKSQDPVDHSVAKGDSTDEDHYDEVICAFPFGLTSLFTNMCAGTCLKNKENGDAETGVWVWPESGPKVSGGLSYEVFDCTHQPKKGKYQNILDTKKYNATFCSCITPYKVIYSKETESPDKIIVGPNVEQGSSTVCAESSSSERELLFQPRVTFDELNELCYLFLVSQKSRFDYKMLVFIESQGG